MVELSPYGIRVVDRINMILMFVVCVVCIRNAIVCISQYKRTKGSMYENFQSLAAYGNIQTD